MIAAPRARPPLGCRMIGQRGDKVARALPALLQVVLGRIALPSAGGAEAGCAGVRVGDAARLAPTLHAGDLRRSLLPGGQRPRRSLAAGNGEKVQRLLVTTSQEGFKAAGRRQGGMQVLKREKAVPLFCHARAGLLGPRMVLATSGGRRRNRNEACNHNGKGGKEVGDRIHGRSPGGPFVTAPVLVDCRSLARKPVRQYSCISTRACWSCMTFCRTPLTPGQDLRALPFVWVNCCRFIRKPQCGRW